MVQILQMDLDGLAAGYVGIDWGLAGHICLCKRQFLFCRLPQYHVHPQPG